MSKKSIADYKAGRHFRCERCNKTCTDYISTDMYSSQDIVLGRIDPCKTKKQYYCSVTCLNTIYKQKMEIYCAEALSNLTGKFTGLKLLYARKIAESPNGNHAPMLSFMKLVKHALMFYEKLIQKNKCEYELHEMRCKINIVAGVALEEYHTNQPVMNYILKSQYQIETIDLYVLCN